MLARTILLFPVAPGVAFSQNSAVPLGYNFLSGNHTMAYSEAHLMEITGIAMGKALLSEPGAWRRYLGILIQTPTSAKCKRWRVDWYGEGSLAKQTVPAGREFIYLEHFLW